MKVFNAFSSESSGLRWKGRFDRSGTGQTVSLNPSPEAAIQRLGESQDLTLLTDAKENKVLVFRDEWRLRWALEKGAEQGLTFYTEAP